MYATKGLSSFLRFRLEFVASSLGASCGLSGRPALAAQSQKLLSEIKTLNAAALRKAMEINDLQAKAMLASVQKLGTFPDVLRRDRRAGNLVLLRGSKSR